MPRPFAPLLFLTLSTVGAPVAAQAVPADASPEQVARTVFDALDERRFADAAALVDRRSAADFRAEEADRWCRNADLTPEMLRRLNPGMTDEEVAGAIRDIRENEVREDEEMRTRYGVAGPDELRRLPAADVLERHLRAEDPERMFERGVAEMRARGAGPSADDLEAMRRTFFPRRFVVGAVEEDGGLAHVIYGFDYRPDAPRVPTMVHTLTMRRTADGWRVVFDRNLPLPRNMNFAVIPPIDGTTADDASDDGG